MGLCAITAKHDLRSSLNPEIKQNINMVVLLCSSAVCDGSFAGAKYASSAIEQDAIA